jgi:hypothetical protein
MKNLKVLNLSIPTLDSSECKALMGGDGYIWGGELDIDVIIRPDNDQPERPDYDLDDDNQDYNQDDYDFDSDDSEEDKEINPPLSEEELNIMLKDMNPILAQKIIEAWKNGLIVKGDGIHHTDKMAYYDTKTGLIVINNLSIDQTILGHEFTHAIQGQNSMLSGDSSNKGDANNEFQANFIQMLLDVTDFGFGYRGWIGAEHNEDWLVNHVNIDGETGQLSIDQTLWDWLNNDERMNEAMNDWLNYWNNIPGTPDVYTEGSQDDWNYNWVVVFDQLGIIHP